MKHYYCVLQTAHPETFMCFLTQYLLHVKYSMLFINISLIALIALVVSEFYNFQIKFDLVF